MLMYSIYIVHTNSYCIVILIINIALVHMYSYKHIK